MSRTNRRACPSKRAPLQNRFQQFSRPNEPRGLLEPYCGQANFHWPRQRLTEGKGKISSYAETIQTPIGAWLFRSRAPWDRLLDHSAHISEQGRLPCRIFTSGIDLPMVIPFTRPINASRGRSHEVLHSG